MRPSILTPQDEAFDRYLEAFELPDQAKGNELRVFGPPGTGKTTYLSNHIRSAIAKFGAKAVLAMSHTTAAAKELVGKGVALPEENVCTIHAAAYRALGKPLIAETILARWNADYPQWRIVGKQPDPEHTIPEGPGDRLLRSINALRATMTLQDRWTPTLLPFWRAWCAWKRREQALDFTDLIERALDSVPIAPGNPSVIIGDEIQDCTPLQAALIRSWGRACVYYILAGDDDQLLYAYAGATPDVLMLPKLDPSQLRFLRISHRLPKSVHRYSTRWTDRLTNRMPKAFLPREEQGCVSRVSTGAFDADGLADRLEKHLIAGKTTMVLASANFALKNVLVALRRRGLPFSNPYRSENSAWNPLGGIGHGVAMRLLAACAGRKEGREAGSLWSGRELRLGFEWLDSSVLVPGMREQLLGGTSDSMFGMDFLERCMRPAHLELLQQRMLHSDAAVADWWRRRLAKEHKAIGEYAAKVVGRGGSAGYLLEKPKTYVGTIHSVKGGQADIVYLLPDLTNRWRADWNSRGPKRDALLRLIYVGSTRAAHTLHLCEPWRRGSSIELGAAA